MFNHSHLSLPLSNYPQSLLPIFKTAFLILITPSPISAVYMHMITWQADKLHYKYFLFP